MTLELTTAIDALYAAFATVRRPREIEYCACCLETEDAATLVTKPLRELTPDDLSKYASAVFLTLGSEEDFRYFIPRILEIRVTTQCWWPDPEVVGRTLTDAKWREWPEPQRAAVTRVLDAKFAALLEPDNVGELESWLCMFACAGMDLAPFLAKLAARPEGVLALYGRLANKIAERRLVNGFWDEAPQSGQQLIDWFHSPPVSMLILESYGVDLNRPR